MSETRFADRSTTLYRCIVVLKNFTRRLDYTDQHELARFCWGRLIDLEYTLSEVLADEFRNRNGLIT